MTNRVRIVGLGVLLFLSGCAIVPVTPGGYTGGAGVYPGGYPTDPVPYAPPPPPPIQAPPIVVLPPIGLPGGCFHCWRRY